MVNAAGFGIWKASGVCPSHLDLPRVDVNNYEIPRLHGSSGIVFSSQREKELLSARAPGQERPLKRKADHDSASPLPHSVPVNCRTVTKQ